MGAPKAEDIIKGLKDKLERYSEIIYDGQTSYNKLVKKLDCIAISLKDYKQYNIEQHLNTVNSFHDKIERIYSQYRGVASKYLKRYGSLFSLKWITKDYDINEILIYILRKIKKGINYIRISNLKTEANLIEKLISQQIAG